MPHIDSKKGDRNDVLTSYLLNQIKFHMGICSNNNSVCGTSMYWVLVQDMFLEYNFCNVPQVPRVPYFT